MNWLQKQKMATIPTNAKIVRAMKKKSSENAIDIFVVGGAAAAFATVAGVDAAAAGSFVCYADFFAVGPKHYVNLSESQT